MKNQVKVSKTETYKDSQGEHYVCRGRLVLVKYFFTKDGATSIVNINKKLYKPIIISETEEIELGDKALHCWPDADYKIVECNKSNKESIQEHWNKILVFPENFSSKHLSAIVDGKLKDGDEVFVECYGGFVNPEWNDATIKLSKDNHIKLFPVKEKESWDDIFDNGDLNEGFSFRNPRSLRETTYLLDWLKKNYHPPVRK